MRSALAQLVNPSGPPADGSVAGLRLQLTKLADLLRNYGQTSHDNRRRQLTALHTRMSELVDAVADIAVARQRVVAEWAQRSFLYAVPPAHRGREGALRVLEEALELAQAEGVSEEFASRLQAYVYGRPAGEPEQELGGVRVALLSYAAQKHLSADRAEQAEIDRVLAKKPEALRQRNREKHAAGVGFFID